MAVEVSDLVPRASGTSSLGAEQLDIAGFSTDIRPFAHVHMNSGVLHDPIYGQSGVLRYDTRTGFTLSEDGGKNFRRLVLDIQDAYDGGNEVQTIRHGTSYQGIAILEPPTPFDGSFGWDDSSDPFVGHTTYGLAVSGAPIPGNPTGSALSRLTSQFLHIRPSGTGSNRSALFIGYPDAVISTPIIASSGSFDFYVNGGDMAYVVAGSKREFIGGSHEIVAQAFISVESVGSYNVIAATTLDLQSDTDRFTVNCFNSSGHLEYLFGPYEAWHTKAGAGSDTLVPIPHSGHVLQMILANAGGGPVSLQTAYDNGHTIVTSANRPVSISGQASDCLSLSSLLYAAIAFSGVVAAPANARQLGDLWFAGHCLRPEHASLVSTFGSANFIGGGLPSLWYHAGNSGVINIRTGSGIVQFFNVASTNFNEQGTYVPFTNTGQVVADRHFRAHNNSGIRVFTEGLYKAIYSVSVEKIAGELTQQANIFIHITRDNGNAFNIFGGESFCHVRNSTNLSQNTANGQAVFDMDAGELFNIFVQESDVPVAPNQVRITARQASVILEFIGPKRGTGGRVQIS